MTRMQICYFLNMIFVGILFGVGRCRALAYAEVFLRCPSRGRQLKLTFLSSEQAGREGEGSSGGAG